MRETNGFTKVECNMYIRKLLPRAPIGSISLSLLSLFLFHFMSSIFPHFVVVFDVSQL